MHLRNILFIAEGQLGDLLLLTPALGAMKTSYPSALLSVLVVERQSSNTSAHPPDNIIVGPLDKQANSVLATNPHVDQLFTLDRHALRTLRGLKRVRAELAVVRFLRGRKFDAAICTFPEDRFTLWAFSSGAKVRVGQKDQRLCRLLTHAPAIKKETNGVLNYYCDLVRAAGATVTSHRTEYFIPEPSHRKVGEILREHSSETGRRFVAVHPGASGDYKIWPPERYASLIEVLQSDGRFTVLLCRGVQDEPVLRDIKTRLRRPVAEVDTGSDVGTFAALLQRCSLCISNDSGPRHLALAVGTPSVAFFRKYHDREWKVYEESEMCATVQGEHQCPGCPPGVCMDKNPPGERFGSHCIRMITVERALERVHRVLRAR